MPLPSRSRSTVPVLRSTAPAVPRAALLLVVLATVVASLLRVLDAGSWSLWIDEGHTWRDATMPIAQFLQADRLQYSLPFFLVRGLLYLKWIGEDPWSLRLPFVVVGILTVPVSAWLGARVVGLWPAVLSAWLLALNPWHVFWSQNARGYVFVVLAAVIAVERAWAYHRSQRVRDVAVMVLAICIGGASHPTAWLMAAGFVAFLILRRVPQLRLRLAVQLVGGIVLLTLLLPLVRPWLPFGWFLRAKADASLLHFLQTTAFYFRPACLLAAAVGVLVAMVRLDRLRALLLGCFGLLPFVLLGCVGYDVAKVTARYAICTLPVLTWLAALVCVHLAAAAWQWQAAAWARVAAAAFLPTLLLGEQVLFLRAYYHEQRGQRAPWGTAVDFLHERAAGRPLRVATVSKPTLLYYLRPGAYKGDVPQQFARNQVLAISDWSFDLGQDENLVPIHAPGAENHLLWHRQRALADGALFAVVVTMPELADTDRGGAFRAALQQHCELVLHLPCWVGPKDESVYVYVWKEP